MDRGASRCQAIDRRLQIGERGRGPVREHAVLDLRGVPWGGGVGRRDGGQAVPVALGKRNAYQEVVGLIPGGVQETIAIAVRQGPMHFHVAEHKFQGILIPLEAQP